MVDPLDAILRPHATPPPPDRLFPATVAALRRARRLQRVRQVGLLTASAAAVFVALLELASPPSPPPQLPQRVGGEVGPGSAPSVVTAAALEWRALEGPGPASTVYRAVGDRYLDEGDPENAVRCYGNALSDGSVAESDFAESDSFLLMAIKLARKKEKQTCER